MSLLFCCQAISQTTVGDSTTPTGTDSLSRASGSEAENLPIYNGRFFYRYSPSIVGIGYFPSDEWQHGSVLYDGDWYHDISILYDVYKDEVIVLHPRIVPLLIFRERIQEFKFSGLRFVRLSPDKDKVIKTGFYQLYVDGPVTIYVRRVRLLKEEISGMQVVNRFETADRFYAMKDGVFYPIHKQNDLLELMKEKRPQVTQYLKQQKLRFKTNREDYIREAALFYNQTSK